MIVEILKLLSRGLNLITGGDFRETFSARIGREAAQGSPGAQTLEAFINMLFFWEPDHYRRAWLGSTLTPTNPNCIVYRLAA